MKSSFDIAEILATANELKYTREIKRLLGEEWNSPSEEFVRYFASRVYSGPKTKARLQQFQAITKSALRQFLRDRIRDRLNSALEAENAASSTNAALEAVEKDPGADSGVITTEDEVSGYYIVKAILRETIKAERISMRDHKSYYAILLDGSNRKPICRLWFSSKQKYLGLMNEQKQENRVPIDNVDEIFKYADQLKAAVGFYS